mmetsp:Transcript_9844/g.23982  ORF Transcript_9844/g.23982 Transcript_9844/m.23982 type:complete len:147 (+) Transcript_9844:806-1246(+)
MACNWDLSLSYRVTNGWIRLLSIAGRTTCARFRSWMVDPSPSLITQTSVGNMQPPKQNRLSMRRTVTHLITIMPSKLQHRKPLPTTHKGHSMSTQKVGKREIIFWLPSALPESRRIASTPIGSFECNSKKGYGGVGEEDNHICALR